jgi:hypothetical protein
MGNVRKIWLAYRSDLEQLSQACHYTNLQPLWWQENLSKGKKFLLKEKHEQINTSVTRQGSFGDY